MDFSAQSPDFELPESRVWPTFLAARERRKLSGPERVFTVPKSSFSGRGFLLPLCLSLCAAAAFPASAAELRGRVVDRGTLDEQGHAKGIAGVHVTVMDGKATVATATTNAKGQYHIRKVPARCRVVYRARGCLPGSQTRQYTVNPTDTGSHDVAFDRPSKEGGIGQVRYWQGVARGMLAMASHAAFFRDVSDTAFVLGGAYVEGDTSRDYPAAVAELLWEETLSQDRPYLSRLPLAQALKARFDSLGWAAPESMAPYLDDDPVALETFAAAVRASLRNPKKIPAAKEARKAGIQTTAAFAVAGRILAASDLTSRKRSQFQARWKQLWGRELPETKDELRAFSPAQGAERLAAAHPGSAVAHLLKGRALYAGKEYGAAAEALGQAGKLRPGQFPAARYLEAMCYMKLGRDSEALGRFQALREAPDPAWKARAYYGLAVLNEKEKRHAEAAADLWRSIRQVPDPDAIFLLAQISAHLSSTGEAEKLLETLVLKDPGEHRAHYWLGRYAEKREQAGVAEDHYRQAYEASPQPEYAEVLGRLYAAREDWPAVLGVLEPVKGRLSAEGRERYADCLLHLGRSRDAAREYSAAYHARPTPALLGRRVDALLQAGKVEEARAAVAAAKDQAHPAAKLAAAKVALRLGETAKARLLLEDLAKREPGNPDLHFLLGLGHFPDRAYGKARKAFDEALRYRADHLEAVYYSGLTLVKTGRPEDARNFFNELAQRTAPEWKAKGFIGVGLSFAAQQKPEAAENYYQRSLGVLETAEGLALLALSKRRLGGPESWEDGAKRAYELDDRHPKAVLAMGELHLAHGRKSQALKLFQKANEATPGSCDILAGLAKSQYLMGQYVAGRGTSAQAISQCPGEAEAYFYAAVTSDKLRNRKEAEDFFRAYRKAGGDEGRLPEDYR